ncbi:MAG: tRNA pseudouridine(55) synthase TruB [Firmicutes bacterium]|nr:tRNA pseudouridine(55) synthase TruB [Bacillota bacterium]
MDGFLLVDKPPGMTSHDVVAVVRRITGMKKIGHTGTLDPLATGLLVLCLGAATKAVAYLTDEPKVYRVEAELGTSTDTQDRTGRVLTRHPECAVTHRALRETLAGFRGPGLQVPPLYSAVRVGGERLYRLARAGRTAVVPPRRIHIEAITLDWPTEAERPLFRCGDRFGFTVSGSRGLYVRTLCHDLGEKLGCGAHLVELRRLAAGPFRLAEAVPLAELTRERVAQNLIPIGRALAHLPSVILAPPSLVRVQHGNPVCLAEPGEATMVLALDETGKAVAVLARRGNLWQPVRVF